MAIQGVSFCLKIDVTVHGRAHINAETYSEITLPSLLRENYVLLTDQRSTGYYVAKQAYAIQVVIHNVQNLPPQRYVYMLMLQHTPVFTFK